MSPLVIRLIVIGVVVLSGGALALLVQRRRPSAPTNPSAYTAPAQVDRMDFTGPQTPWLVAVFTSATCQSCGEVWAKAAMLESDEVATMNVEVGDRHDLHARYGIDAVPITVIADAEGIVQRSFVGPVSSTHLWGAVAELRSPGSVPPGCGASGNEGDRTSEADQAGAAPKPG